MSIEDNENNEDDDDNEDNADNALMVTMRTITTMTVRSQIFVTYQTLIKFLTIENNYHNIHCDPSKKSDTGQHCNVFFFHMQ